MTKGYTHSLVKGLGKLFFHARQSLKVSSIQKITYQMLSRSIQNYFCVIQSSKSLNHENSECLATLSVNTDQTLHYKPSNAIQIGLPFSSQCQTVTSDETSDTFIPQNVTGSCVSREY